MATEATEALVEQLRDEELVIQVRQYIALRSELMERGAMIVKQLESKRKTVVFVHGDEAFEVGKSYASGDLPLIVRPAVVLGT